MRSAWMVASTTVILFLASASGQTFPIAPNDPIIREALGYVAAHQNPDGGFGQLGESELSASSRAIEAIVAADGDPQAYLVEGKGPTDYLLSVSEKVYKGEYGSNPLADRINLILAVSALGLDPRQFGGRDHLSALLDEQNETTKAFGTGVSDTAYSVLALLAAGVPVDDPALQGARDYIEASQLSEGSFEYTPGWGPDSNTHAIVLITLKKMGSFTECFRGAVSAIPDYQNATDRGFYYQAMWGTKSDVTSTALGIQAILAAGGSPYDPPYAVGSGDPATYLLSVQNQTTGEFFDPWGSLRPTVFTIPALLGKLTPGVRVSEALSVLMGVLAAAMVWRVRGKARGDQGTGVSGLA